MQRQLIAAYIDNSFSLEGFTPDVTLQSYADKYVSHLITSDEFFALCQNYLPQTKDETRDALAWARGYQYLEKPFQARFDLKEFTSIHAFIFQDSPYIRPGEIRSDCHGDYIKNRALDDLGMNYPVFYATKDIATKLHDALAESKAIANEEPKSLETFAMRLSRLYAQLDYIHPFLEGNSRTLRLFLSKLAAHQGYDLDWNLTGFQKSRSVLYLARDVEVIEKQFPELDGNKAFSPDSTKNELEIYRYFLSKINSPIRLFELISAAMTSR